MTQSYSLSEYIDSYISNNQWSGDLTDDENIAKILDGFGSKGNEKVMYWLVKNTIETKIQNGEYECYMIYSDDEYSD